MKSSQISGWAAFCGSWFDGGFLLLSDFSAALLSSASWGLPLMHMNSNLNTPPKKAIMLVTEQWWFFFVTAWYIEYVDKRALYLQWHNVQGAERLGEIANLTGNPCVEFLVVAHCELQEANPVGYSAPELAKFALIGRKLPHSLLQLAQPQ